MSNKSPLERDAASVKVGFCGCPNKKPIVDAFSVAEPNRDPLDVAEKPNPVVDLEDDIDLGDDSLTALCWDSGSSSSSTIFRKLFLPSLPHFLSFVFDAIAKSSNKVMNDTD